MMRFTGRRSKAAGVSATAAVAVGALVLWGSGGGTPHSAMKASLAGSDTVCSPAGSLPITVGGILPAPADCPGMQGVIAPPAPPTITPTATPTSTPTATPTSTSTATPTSTTGTQPSSGVVIGPFPAPGDDDEGPGEACVFARTSGAGRAGHIGWGWEAGSTGHYYFGATEDPSGLPIVFPSTPNAIGAWHDDRAGKAQMLAVFANPASDPVVTGTAGNNVSLYNLYRCEPTPVSHVAAAIAAIIRVESAGYCVVGQNCLDAAITILTAYGATRLPSPTFFNAIPNNWFNKLPLPWDTPPLPLS